MIEDRKRYLDVDGVAEYLSLSKYTIRDWIKKRQIPFIKFKRAVRFDLQEIDIWLKDKKMPCLSGRYLNHCFSYFSRISFN